MPHYPDGGQWAMADPLLIAGERVRLDGYDRRWWWTVRAVGEHFAVLTRQAEFQPKGVLRYTVLDWRNGVRGPCDLVGQSWGDGTYSDRECAGLLAAFESGEVRISQRNWVRLVLLNY